MFKVTIRHNKLKPNSRARYVRASTVIAMTIDQQPVTRLQQPTKYQRKAILVKKKACFNCTGLAHRASECRSTTKCKNCGKRHHISICGETEQPKPALAAHREEDQQVIYPTVLVEIDGVKAHVLLDAGAGSSYASAKLIDAIKGPFIIYTSGGHRREIKKSIYKKITQPLWVFKFFLPNL